MKSDNDNFWAGLLRIAGQEPLGAAVIAGLFLVVYATSPEDLPPQAWLGLLAAWVGGIAHGAGVAFCRFHARE